MYLQFYGFKETPFNLTPDSKFLFLSHRHQEALAALLFGVQERKGFISLTGEIGCGKTTLCRAMLSQLDPVLTRTCVVLNSYLNDLELLQAINEGFELAADSDSKKVLLDRLNNYLIEQFSEGRNVVLIIDEAQNLRPETLEQIRMISNLETETAKLIQIVLIGQPELRQTLTLPELEQLNQRITVRYHVAPLDENELPEYVMHRLAVAEPQVEVTFTPQAMKLIYHFSRGVPRRINVICDRCLLVGYIEGTFNIDDRIVQRAVSEVRGDVQGSMPVNEAARGALDSGDKSRGPRLMLPALKLVGVVALLLGCMLGAGMMAIRYVDRRAVEAERQATAQQLAAAQQALAAQQELAAKQLAAAQPKTPASAAAVPAHAGEIVDVVSAPKNETPAPTASPTPTPTPAPTPTLYDNWQYDTENVLRVRQPELAEAASFINLLRRWNIELDLAEFRKIAPKDFADYDMLGTIKPLNFEAYRTDNLNEALRMNLPVLVRLEGSPDLAPYGVIVAMQGDVLEYIDPIHGRRMERRPKLEPLVKESIVPFQDKLKLDELTPGVPNDRVKELQKWLATEKCYEGEPDGKLGQRTREAIEKLQMRNGLKETGKLDALTAALISTRLNPRKPRLY